MKIKYDGEYPNLCAGNLVITIDGKEWKFPSDCLSSGGSVTFDDDWNENVSSGPWSVTKWPKSFPANLKKSVEDAINENITHGCCEGCV